MEIQYDLLKQNIEYRVLSLIQVDLNHKSGKIVVDYGVDLTDYYPSIEWDILRVVKTNIS